jgi:hypothetical protein
MEYTIEEIFEIICDIDKVLSVQFRIEGDGEGYYRELLDSDYYDWCYEKYVTEEDRLMDLYEEEEGDYYEDSFSVDMWNMYYSNEEIVID